MSKQQDWDEYFLNIAEAVAQKSKDPSSKMGCVIVDQNKRVVSLGYNGMVQGADESKMTMSERPMKYYFAIHSEMNAVLFAHQPLEGCTLYYPLATPTDTEITNEALIDQLEAIANARLYGNQTNIVIAPTGDNAGSTMEISYMTEQNPDRRDEIVIDSRLRTITLNGLDIYHLKTAGSEFLMLAPGENKLSLQSDITGDNGYAEVSYKQGYLSI